MNSINIIGRLTRDPEARETKSGKPVANFTIAYNAGRDEAHFFDCVAWDKSASLVSEHFHKGKEIGISGTLKQEKWQASDGSNRSKCVIHANRITFIGSKADAADAPPVASGAATEDDIPF